MQKIIEFLITKINLIGNWNPVLEYFFFEYRIFEWNPVFNLNFIQIFLIMFLFGHTSLSNNLFLFSSFFEDISVLFSTFELLISLIIFIIFLPIIDILKVKIFSLIKVKKQKLNSRFWLFYCKFLPIVSFFSTIYYGLKQEKIGKMDYLKIIFYDFIYILVLIFIYFGQNIFGYYLDNITFIGIGMFLLLFFGDKIICKIIDFVKKYFNKKRGF